ncbi:hypothetical protein KEU06_27510 [Pseudaminobacter sp. 19-2017]|uniref:Uncharacterized protein n=2 Tax=Pseudaminobacter soli (ex Zhang et al. 2022) TaxID=2831468 RepID=A0A942E1Y4_9HYPH|nr:hypothetical protein [Pseudaminobacter soli]
MKVCEILGEQDVGLGMPAKGKSSALAAVAKRLGERVGRGREARMSISADPARLDAWHRGALTESDLTSALICDAEAVRVLLDVLDCQTGHGENQAPLSLPPRARVGIAISYALHSQAGLSLANAADIAAKSVKVSDSVLAALDFFPPANPDSVESSAKRHWRDESDPFALFVPHADEELPGVDEYLDVIDDRRIVWRKPRCDAYELACDLDRLSDAMRRENSPALQEEYLAVLSRVREPADQVAEWMGMVGDDGFRPVPDRFTDVTPFLRHGIELTSDGSYCAQTYPTRISVNVSLAARSMKRRVLGLSVTGPLEGPAASPPCPERLTRWL